MATPSSPLVTACWTVNPPNSRNFEFNAGVTLAKQANRPGHHHPPSSAAEYQGAAPLWSGGYRHSSASS